MNVDLEAQLNDDSNTIMEALAYGITGDTARGLELLRPIIYRGPAATVGLCAALAESASMTARQRLPEGGFFGLLVATTDGTAASVDDLPPGIRFAAQFANAWANGDRATAHALFDALVVEQTDEEAEALAVGIRALFDMATVTLREMTGR